MQLRESIFKHVMATSRHDGSNNSLFSMLSSTTWAMSRTLTGTPISGSVCGTATFNFVDSASHSEAPHPHAPINAPYLRYIEDGTLTLGSSTSQVHLPVKQEYLYVDSISDDLKCGNRGSVSCEASTSRTEDDTWPLGVLFPDGRPFLQFKFPQPFSNSGHKLNEDSRRDLPNSALEAPPSWLAEVSSLSPETHLNGEANRISAWTCGVDSHLCLQDLYNSKFYLGFLDTSSGYRAPPFVVCMEYVVKGPKKDYTARTVLVRIHSKSMPDKEPYNPQAYASPRNSMALKPHRVDPQSLDCGRKLTFDDSVIDVSEKETPIAPVSSTMEDLTRNTNNAQNNRQLNHRAISKNKYPLGAPPSHTTTTTLKDNDESVLQQTFHRSSPDLLAAATSSTKYSILFNPQGSRPLSDQLTFPGRHARAVSSVTTTSKAPTPSSLRLVYASNIRSQVLSFGRNTKSGSPSTIPSITYTTVMMDGALAETNMNSVALVGNCASHKIQKKSLHLSKVGSSAHASGGTVAPHSDILVLQVGIPHFAFSSTFLSTGTHFSVDVVVSDHLSSASSHLYNRRHIIVNLHDLLTMTACNTNLSPSAQPANCGSLSGVASVNPQHCRISLPLDIQFVSGQHLDHSSIVVNQERECQWFSLVVDVRSVIENLYSSTFKGIESVSVTASNIQLRRVFCCASHEKQDSGETVYYLPKLMSFPVSNDNSIVVSSSTITVKSEGTAKLAVTPSTLKKRSVAGSEACRRLTKPPTPRRPTVSYGAASLVSSTGKSPLKAQQQTAFQSPQAFSVSDTRKVAPAATSHSPVSHLGVSPRPVTKSPPTTLPPEGRRTSAILNEEHPQHRTHPPKQPKEVAFPKASCDDFFVEDDGGALTPIRHDIADVASTVDCSFTVEYPSLHQPLKTSPPTASHIFPYRQSSSSAAIRGKSTSTGIKNSADSVRRSQVWRTAIHSQEQSQPKNDKGNDRSTTNLDLPVPAPVFGGMESSLSQNQKNAGSDRFQFHSNDRYSQCDSDTVSMSSDVSSKELEIHRSSQRKSDAKQSQEISAIPNSGLSIVEKSIPKHECEGENEQGRSCSVSTTVSDVTVVLMDVGEGKVGNCSVRSVLPPRPSTVRILRPPQKQQGNHLKVAPKSHQIKSPQPAVDDRTFISEPMSFLLRRTPSSPQTSSCKSREAAVTKTPQQQHWYDVEDWIAQTGTSSQDCSPSPTSNGIGEEEGVEFDPVIGCYFNTKSNTYEQC